MRHPVYIYNNKRRRQNVVLKFGYGANSQNGVQRYILVKHYHKNMRVLRTALRNHMRIIFEEMSSLTPLTLYLGMKTTFETKYI